ncbi:MAG TPA: DUF2461 domain-containing protein, partial [Mycobacteriales bacterium]|nr:DUF2461 domain-containing protein [Mycobacteriales bacterium]
SGWPAEALEFYEGLLADNSKTYWTANKSTYDDLVRAPMVALLAELEPEFGPAKIYRPYRDVRFSKDKSPYKTQIAASFERGGYIRLSSEGLGAGSGMYMFSPEQVQRWREAVADDKSGKALVKVLDGLHKQDIGVSSHDTLARVPTGYAKDHARAELLRYKDLVAWRDWPVAAWLGTAKAKTRIEEFFRTCAPLNDWLQKHVA